MRDKTANRYLGSSFVYQPTALPLRQNVCWCDSETQTFNFDGSSTLGRKGIEFGLAVGGMYELDDGIGIGLRYTRAFSDIASDNSFGGTTYKQKYNVFQVLISYTIGEI